MSLAESIMDVFVEEHRIFISKRRLSKAHHQKKGKRMTAAPLITIVDDDDSLRSSLNNLLRSLGYRTQGFASAEDFLNSNDLNDTACLILDVRMPGMSGLSLQHHLVAANSRLPIVFITSHADDDARTRALEAGAVAFLYKPCREETLLEAIGSALQR
jgi:FixJ family two-component response regulator